MLNTFKFKTKSAATSLPAIIAFIMLGACSNGGNSGPGTISGITNAPVPPTPPNENITVLSAGNTANTFAVDETFDVASSLLVTRLNDNGTRSVISRSRSDFREPSGSVFFDAETGSLTFNFTEGDVVVNETFGPILSTPVGDFDNLENDQLAIVISTFPEDFSIPDTVVLPNGAQTLEDLRGDPEAVDLLIEDLTLVSNAASTGESAPFDPSAGPPTNTVSAFGSSISPEAAADLLAQFQTETARNLSFGFVSHLGSEGNFFAPLRLAGNNTGIEPRHVQLGVWVVDVPGGEGDNNVAFGGSVFGQLTPANEVPNSGSASYNTTLGGYLSRNGTLEFLTGGVDINANFDTRRVDLGINSVIQTFGANGEAVFTDFVSLDGEGLLTGGNRFDGDLRGTVDQSIRGEIAGAFFGPFATEVGGTLRFGNDSFEAAGAFVGTQDGDGTP